MKSGFQTKQGEVNQGKMFKKFFFFCFEVSVMNFSLCSIEANEALAPSSQSFKCFQL